MWVHGTLTSDLGVCVGDRVHVCIGESSILMQSVNC